MYVIRCDIYLHVSILRSDISSNLLGSQGKGFLSDNHVTTGCF